MCTVTLFPHQERGEPGLRLACNRDEAVTRPPALPPQLHTFGQRTALFPVDPLSGGTWIAVSDAGWIGVVLNRNPESSSQLNWTTRSKKGLKSRGHLLPNLLHCPNVASAQQLALGWQGQDFAPFTLLLADCQQLSVIEGGGAAPVCLKEWTALQTPRMFTSSGLGDAVVEEPRAKLFQNWFHSGTNLGWSNRGNQLAFHRHSWPEQQHLSVCMRRADARTVSCTTIDLCSGAARLTYFPQAPDEPSIPILHSLLLRQNAQHDVQCDQHTMYLTPASTWFSSALSTSWRTFSSQSGNG